MHKDIIAALKGNFAEVDYFPIVTCWKQANLCNWVQPFNEYNAPSDRKIMQDQFETFSLLDKICI